MKRSGTAILLMAACAQSAQGVTGQATPAEPGGYSLECTGVEHVRTDFGQGLLEYDQPLEVTTLYVNPRTNRIDYTNTSDMTPGRICFMVGAEEQVEITPRRLTASSESRVEDTVTSCAFDADLESGEAHLQLNAYLGGDLGFQEVGWSMTCGPSNAVRPSLPWETQQ